MARWPWRTNFLCQQADEICISTTELAIDFIAQDGRAENLRATLVVAMATSPAFARKGSHHHSKARLSTGRPGPIGMTFHAIPTTSRSTEISGAFVGVSSRGQNHALRLIRTIIVKVDSVPEGFRVLETRHGVNFLLFFVRHPCGTLMVFQAL